MCRGIENPRQVASCESLACFAKEPVEKSKVGGYQEPENPQDPQGTCRAAPQWSKLTPSHVTKNASFKTSLPTWGSYHKFIDQGRSSYPSTLFLRVRVLSQESLRGTNTPFLRLHHDPLLRTCPSARAQVFSRLKVLSQNF